MRCKERSGFLFAHACDHVVATHCTRCGKSVCADHVRPSGLCVSCDKRGAATTERAARGSRHSGYYDEHDQQVFDPQAAPVEDLEGDFDGS